MTIQINERSNPEFFVHVTSSHTRWGGGLHCIVRSGVLLLPNESAEQARAANRPWAPDGFRGVTPADWRGETIDVSLDLRQSITRLNPPATDQKHYWGFNIEQWAPLASLNSVYNRDVSNNAGSSVNTFRVLDQPDDDVHLVLGVAVRDSDGFLFRVGFYLTLVGRLVQLNNVE
jgi:hypothetical protein